MKEVKYGWQDWMMSTVMLVFSLEALKSGNRERINLWAHIVVPTISRVSGFCLFAATLLSKIMKSQLFPLSKIWPRSSERVKLWSSECVELLLVKLEPGNNRKC